MQLSFSVTTSACSAAKEYYVTYEAYNDYRPDVKTLENLIQCSSICLFLMRFGKVLCTQTNAH